MTLHDDKALIARLEAAMDAYDQDELGDDVHELDSWRLLYDASEALRTRHPEPTVSDGEREGDAWCPGCGERVPVERVREYGSCHDCIGTTDDPWLAAGYRKAPVVSVEDVAKTVADADMWWKARATTERGHWDIHIATAVLALLEGGGK